MSPQQKFNEFTKKLYNEYIAKLVTRLLEEAVSLVTRFNVADSTVSDPTSRAGSNLEDSVDSFN